MKARAAVSLLGCPVHVPEKKWSLRQDWHLHLTAYETAALLIMLRSEKEVPAGGEAGRQ